MPLRIAQLAPPLERVPPVGYGGTERVIHTLTEELVRRGHEVTLFASGDSQTSARLVPTFDEAVWHHKPAFEDVIPSWTVVLGKVQRQLREFDIVHSHLDHFGLPLSRQSDVPVVTTFHGRLDFPELLPVFTEFIDAPLVSISDAQRRPVAWANFVATVHHGIDLAQFTFRSHDSSRMVQPSSREAYASGLEGRHLLSKEKQNPPGGGYLAFLGRVSAEKGLDRAIRIARKVGMPLKVAARKPLPYVHLPRVGADWAYWEQQVQPLLGSDIELIGEVGGTEKDDFLGNAAALLFPIDWPEPFGLVMVEALACGTPVLAMRRGSVSELISDGRTGFVRDTEDELAEAVRCLDQIDRAHCRFEAERRFSAQAMASAHERVYEALLADGRRTRAFAFDGLEGLGARQAVASSLLRAASSTTPM